jgi:hypothetical protein
MIVRQQASGISATTTIEDSPKLAAIKRWFFTAFACVMIVVASVGFLPSLLHTAGRRAPLSLLTAAHGTMFFVWLAIFLAQTRLVASRRVALHKRLGVVAVCWAAFMVPLAYATSISMVRRGFDLSGDLGTDHDPAYEVIFPLGDVFMFAVLFTAAIAFRRRPDVHKRLMLFANLALMPAPLAHLIGHTPWLAALPGAIIMIPISLFLVAAVAREFVVMRRVHPLTWGLAVGMLASGPLRAGIIGPSAPWHGFVHWLAR